MLAVTENVAIPEQELEYTTSRSSGPGGQHVNTADTRVTLRFDLAATETLNEEQKARIQERLAGRISRAGILRVTSQRHRSQHANKEAATGRFVQLLAEALEESPPRRPTRPPRSKQRKRLEEKKRLAQKKRERSRDYTAEDF